MLGWVQDCTMMADRPPKSIKLEANFIPEKENNNNNHHKAHKAHSAVPETTARDPASEIVVMETGFEPFVVKSSTRCGS